MESITLVSVTVVGSICSTTGGGAGVEARCGVCVPDRDENRDEKKLLDFTAVAGFGAATFSLPAKYTHRMRLA